MTAQLKSLSLEPASRGKTDDSPADSSSAHRNPAEFVEELADKACLKRAAQRLSPALLHVVHHSTAKRRDRALAALIVLIYGPTPFGGANNVKDVATRYGMTERNLHQLMDTLRGLIRDALPDHDPSE